MKKKKRSRNLKWATAHLSTGWGAQALGHSAARAQARGALGHAGVAAGTGAWGSSARGARQEQHGRAARALGARPGRAAGPVGSALGALSLFLAQFDSVFFRSLIFGHCS